MINYSDKLDKISPALLKAQMDSDTPKKDSKNPFHKNEYASLDSVILATKKALTANGISQIQWLSNINGVASHVTMLLHESGQWLQSECPIDDKPQRTGSCQTYFRRYNSQGSLSVSTEVDDDGNAGQGNPVNQHQQASQTATSTPNTANRYKTPSAVKTPPVGNNPQSVLSEAELSEFYSEWGYKSQQCQDKPSLAKVMDDFVKTANKKGLTESQKNVLVIPNRKKWESFE